jgi:cell division protein FtsL
MTRAAIIMGMVMVILVMTFAIYVVKPLMKKVGEETTKIESKIGKKFIYNKDTVMVVDYSTFNSTYTLSDGSKVSFKIIEQLDSIR